MSVRSRSRRRGNFCAANPAIRGFTMTASGGPTALRLPQPHIDHDGTVPHRSFALNAVPPSRQLHAHREFSLGRPLRHPPSACIPLATPLPPPPPRPAPVLIR